MKFSIRLALQNVHERSLKYWHVCNTRALMFLLLCCYVSEAYSQEDTAPKSSEFSATLVIDTSIFSIRDNPEHSVTRGLLDLSYEYSSESWSIFSNLQLQRGGNGSDDIGDIQAFSNIDEADFEKIYEAWLQFEVSNDMRIKVGQIDMNGEFAFADNAADFINSSMGFSPTIFALPTYPDPALGGVLGYRLSQNSELSVGFNAGADHDDFSDMFYIAEWRYLADNVLFKIGVWHHDGQFEYLDNVGSANGVKGLYAIAEGQIQASDIGYYLQYGTANEEVSEITQHLGVGFTGKINELNNLSMGIGMSAVQISRYLGTPESTEIAWEMFAIYEISDNFIIKPDLQYIASPAGEARNEMVATFRLELSF